MKTNSFFGKDLFGFRSDINELSKYMFSKKSEQTLKEKKKQNIRFF